jgi:hypothetical protein
VARTGAGLEAGAKWNEYGEFIEPLNIDELNEFNEHLDNDE